MAEVPLNIKLSLQSAEVRKALKGVQREVEKVEAATRKELQKTDDMRRRSLRMQKDQSRDLGRAFNTLGRGIERELQSSIFTGAKRGIQRAKQFLKSNQGAILGALGGVGVGAVVAGRAAFGQARAITPEIPTLQENIQAAKQFQFRQARFASRAELDPAELQAQILAAVRGTTIMPGQVLAGAETVQERIGKEGLPAFFENLGTLTQFSEGLGVPMGDLGAIVVELNRQFGITAKQMPEALGLLAEQAEAGSIEFGDFIGSFRKVMGTFKVSLERDGIDGLREFGTVAQAVGTTMDPDMAATSMLRFVRDITSTETIGKLRRTSVGDVTGMEIPEIVERIRGADLSKKQMEKIFVEERSMRAVEALLGTTPQQLESLQLIHPGMGLERARLGTEAVRRTELGKGMIEAVAINEEVMGSFKDVSGAARDLVTWFERLRAENPAAGLLAGPIAQGVGVGGLSLAALKGLFPATAAKIFGGASAAMGAGAPLFGPGAAMGTGALLGKAFPDVGSRVNKALGGFPLLYDPSRGTPGRTAEDLEKAAMDLKVGARQFRTATEDPRVGRAE